VNQMMTLMTIGLYNEPAGAYLPLSCTNIADKPNPSLIVP